MQKENLIKAFDFSEMQAEAIVTLQLYRLSNTDIIALEQESVGLSERIKELEHILSSEQALRRVIKRELSEMSDTLGEPRKTEIEAEIENIKIDKKDLISDEKSNDWGYEGWLYKTCFNKILSSITKLWIKRK